MLLDFLKKVYKTKIRRCQVCVCVRVAAVQAAESYMEIQPLHQTIGDTVVTALTAWAKKQLDKVEYGM